MTFYTDLFLRSLLIAAMGLFAFGVSAKGEKTVNVLLGVNLLLALMILVLQVKELAH